MLYLKLRVFIIGFNFMSLVKDKTSKVLLQGALNKPVNNKTLEVPIDQMT
jgi:hypothetical protein